MIDLLEGASLSKQTEPDIHLKLRLILLSKILSILVGLIGFAVVIGWSFDINYLKSVLPTFVPMKANSAFGFILTSLSLLLLQGTSFTQSPTRIILAKLLALNIFVIGCLTFMEHLFLYDFHIDQFVFQQVSNFPSAYPPGRMAPVTSIVFMFTGLGLMAIDLKQQLVTQLCGYIIGIFGIFVLIGIIYNIQTEHQLVSFAYAAIHAAICFVLISVSLFLIRPDEGVMILLTHNGEAGMLTRLMIPVIVIASGLFGYLMLVGLHNQLYDLESGTALFATANIGLFILIAVFISVKFLRADLDWKKKLQNSQKEIDDLYNFAPCGYHSLNSNGFFIRINQTELNWLGYSPGELIGKIKFSELLTPASLTIFQQSFPKLLEIGYIANLELELIRKDKSTFIVLLTSAVIRDVNGQFLMTRTTLINIDERKRMQKALAEKQQSLKLDKEKH